MASRKGLIVVALAGTTAVLSAFVAYASRIAATDWPAWFSFWAVTHRATISFVAFVTALISGSAEAGRWYFDRRHPDKDVVQKIVDAFSSKYFQDRARRNRVTLFIETSGFRAFCHGLLCVPLFDKLHKWRALWGIKWRSRYLRVYVRAAGARNGRSCAAFRVSDNADECAGVAGRAWEEGFCMVRDLVKVNRADVHALESLAALQAAGDICRYASDTNVSDLRTLKSIDHFGRHFMGTVIRGIDGLPRGVLLLDVEEDVCPFTTEEGDSLVGSFIDTATIIGKIV